MLTEETLLDHNLAADRFQESLKKKKLEKYSKLVPRYYFLISTYEYKINLCVLIFNKMYNLLLFNRFDF